MYRRQYKVNEVGCAKIKQNKTRFSEDIFLTRAGLGTLSFLNTEVKLQEAYWRICSQSKTGRVHIEISLKGAPPTTYESTNYLKLFEQSDVGENPNL